MKYNEKDVLTSFKRMNNIRVSNNVIEVVKNTAGNKTLGKIDYLTTYCGYTALFVDNLPTYRRDSDNI